MCVCVCVCVCVRARVCVHVCIHIRVCGSHNYCLMFYPTYKSIPRIYALQYRDHGDNCKKAGRKIAVAGFVAFICNTYYAYTHSKHVRRFDALYQLYTYALFQFSKRSLRGEAVV